MPDKDGNVKGISVPAQAWERIFGKKSNVMYPTPVHVYWRRCNQCVDVPWEPCRRATFDPNRRTTCGRDDA